MRCVMRDSLKLHRYSASSTSCQVPTSASLSARTCMRGISVKHAGVLRRGVARDILHAGRDALFAASAEQVKHSINAMALPLP
eukprot:5833782-Pleurochrysis_carterae.AAC.3